MSIVRNITADISTTAQPFTVSGDFRIYSSGLFGGGTVQLQRRQTNGEFKNVIGSAYTALFNDVISSDAGERYRFTMAGSTTPTTRIEVPGAIDFNAP